MNKITNRWIIILSLLCCFSCSQGPLKPDTARKIIARQLSIPEKRIEVKGTSGADGTVIIDAAVQLAFLLQKDARGEWHVVKIKKTTGEWQSPEEFLKTFTQP